MAVILAGGTFDNQQEWGTMEYRVRREGESHRRHSSTEATTKMMWAAMEVSGGDGNGWPRWYQLLLVPAMVGGG